MSDSMIIHTDGGARGNPGPAAYAFVLSRPGSADEEHNGYLGTATNNVAEYTAVVKALERAKELGGKKVTIKSDSELMVKQMNGLYKVKNPGLLPLHQEAQKLRRAFDEVKFQHVRREQNAEADRLCNEAMDARRGTTHETAVPRRSVNVPDVPTAPHEKGADPWHAARAEGIAVLQKAAQAWRKGETMPAVAQVWNDLLSVLEKHELIES